MAAHIPLSHSTTPYLDRQIPLPGPNPKYAKLKWWQALLFAPLLLVEIFRVLFLLYLLHILLHEIGHVIAGLTVGDQFCSIRIGPFEIDRARKVSWHWGWNSIFSGSANTLPTKRSGLNWKYFIFVLGGPLANLSSAFLMLLFMVQKASLLGAWGQLFVVVGAIIGVTNLAPTQQYGQMSDGIKLWILLFNKPKRERLMAIRVWFADRKQGRGGDSFKGYSIEKWSSLNDGDAAQVIANWAAYVQSNDAEQTGIFLENCLAQCSSTTHDFRDILILEAANYQISRRNRIDLAQEWLRVYKPKKMGIGHLWVEALILRSLKQFDLAISKVDTALDFLMNHSDSSANLQQRERFEKLRTSLCEQMAESAKMTASS